MEKFSGRISEVEIKKFPSRRRLRNFYEHPKIRKLNKFQHLKIQIITMKSNRLSGRSIYIVVTFQ